MGLVIPHAIGPSAIHGTGLFAAAPLAEGTLLWCYQPGLDSRRRLQALPAALRPVALHYGYVNPLEPEWVVVCGDHARFWNFPPLGCAANAIPSARTLHGEALILAARAIRAGEELLIDPSSDADYQRKLAAAPPQLVSEPWWPRAS